MWGLLECGIILAFTASAATMTMTTHLVKPTAMMTGSPESTAPADSMGDITLPFNVTLTSAEITTGVSPESTTPTEITTEVSPESTAPAEITTGVSPESTAPAEITKEVSPESTAPAEITKEVSPESTAPAEITTGVSLESTTPAEITPVVSPESTTPAEITTGLSPESTAAAEITKGVSPENTALAEITKGVYPESTAPAEITKGVYPESTAPAEITKGVSPESTAPAEITKGVYPESTAPAEITKGVYPESTTPAEPHRPSSTLTPGSTGSDGSTTTRHPSDVGTTRSDATAGPLASISTSASTTGPTGITKTIITSSRPHSTVMTTNRVVTNAVRPSGAITPIGNSHKTTTANYSITKKPGVSASPTQQVSTGGTPVTLGSAASATPSRAAEAQGGVPGWGIALLVLAAAILLLLFLLLIGLLIWCCLRRRYSGFSPYDQLNPAADIPLYTTHSRFEASNGIPYSHSQDESETTPKNRTYTVNG